MTTIRTGSYHVVSQGESVDSVAALCGLQPETIWDAPENGELKRQRKERHILMPGDRLFIPPIQPKTASVPTGQLHRFTVQRPRARLKVQIVEDGRPRANEPFVLRVDGEAELRGATDGSGWVDQSLPPLAREASLTVGEGEAAVTYPLLLRALDPITEISGIQGRLRNLGYAEVTVDGELGPATVAALCAFQRDHGLSVTGKPDQATQGKLEAQHGS